MTTQALDTDGERPEARHGARDILRRILSNPEAGVALVIAVLVIGISIVNSTFLTETNIFNILRAVSITGIVAVGMTFVMVSGELDLSVGATVAFTAIAGTMASSSLGWPLGLAVGFLAGMAVGLTSALIVTRLGVNSFIVTLGMLSIVRGLSLYLSDGLPQRGLSQLEWLGRGKVGPVPAQVLVLFVVVLVGQLVIRRTVFGETVQAIGDNSEAARLSGIGVARVKTICFILLGALCALAGLIRLGQLGVAEPNAGVGLELDVIAAVVIGGASLSGGRGSVLGALLGAVLLGVLRNAFVLLQFSNFLQVISIGVVIVLAAIFDRLRVGRS